MERRLQDRRRTKPSLRPSQRKGRLLHVRSGLSAEKTLLLRVGIVAALIALVIAVFWFDRDGLKDQIDGHISFPDILYFAMITVTTVGYGDIVPVSHTARLIDAFAVTPIRIFIWFIFLGTAYELVVQRIVEEFRLSRIQKQLQGHIVLCGFGHSGFIAAQETVSKGHPADHIVVIDESEDRIQLAADCGFVGLLGDGTSEDTLKNACVGKAKAVIVSTGRDDTTILVILTVRHLSAATKIVANIKQEENIKLANLSGADLVVSPPKIGGYLMADAVETRYATPFLCDLMSAGGQMVLSERRAEPDEVGLTMAEVTAGMVVQVHSHGRDIPFTERNRYIIQPQDTLLIISPPTDARNPSPPAG
ncbi:potassium channel family protein [Azospirillum palustre]|uniref:potassium channel family protein n=1 Tax=Azospirillum palustre TaxID=2044885 RepID=UPI001FCE3067|nr:potassium channel family protein [Azospirillum palustre]